MSLYFFFTRFCAVQQLKLIFCSLNNIPGIYMITKKVTKKFYIGMSTNLKGIFQSYLSVKRLNSNRSSRIHKALLKYGFDNFSISILELDKDIKNKHGPFWREREDFFIKVFKPQYNIKRSFFNMGREITFFCSLYTYVNKYIV